MRQVGEVKGPRATEESGNTFLTKIVQPIKEATDDTDPVRIEQRGSVQTRTRQTRILQPFADGLKRYLVVPRTTASSPRVLKVLRQLSTPTAFQTAVAEAGLNRPSIVKHVVTLFPDMFKTERRGNTLYVASVDPRSGGPTSSNLNLGKPPPKLLLAQWISRPHAHWRWSAVAIESKKSC